MTRTALLAVTLALLVAACGEDDAAPQNRPVSGQFTIVTRWPTATPTPTMTPNMVEVVMTAIAGMPTTTPTAQARLGILGAESFTFRVRP